MIHRYYLYASGGDSWSPAELFVEELDDGDWVKHSDHAAEVARLSRPSPAVARLVEACKRLREHIVEQWPQGMTCSCGECAWCWETSDVAAADEALAAVEKEMQP